MKTSIKIILIGIVLLGLTYIGIKYLGLAGLFPTIAGIFGITIFRGNEKIKKLEALQKEGEKQLKDIEAKREDLKKNGVKDLTDQEEVDYWKNQ